MRHGIKLMFVLSIMILLAGHARGAIKVYAQVDTSKDIYFGENFAYYIVIGGENKAGQVDLTPLAPFHPKNTGNRDVSQTSINIINGKTTKSITKQYVMGYSLIAEHPGQIHLPSVTVTIDGNDYRTNAIDVNILKPGTTDLLDLEIELSENQCYVGQPIIMTVKFYISADIGDFQFNIPVFNGDDFFVEDNDTSNQQAKEYDIGNGITARISQFRTTHNGKDSILLSFSKVLIPKRSGSIVISAASVSADVAIGRSRSHDSFSNDPFFNDFFGSRKTYKRFMVSSNPLNVKVSPLPEKGRPDAFYGLVGQYSISASAQPTQVNVGDPITLTIKIGGSKFLKLVQWPDLEQIPELADNFKIPSEKASPTIKEGYKIFTQTIRAANDKISKIPSIPLAYFDVAKGEYAVARTDPIKLDVSPTKILTSADVESTESVSANKEVESIKKGLSANYETLDALTHQSLSPFSGVVHSSFVVIWVSPMALLLVSTIIKLITNKTPEKTALRHRRTAATRSINLLKSLASAKPESRYEQLALAMKQYLGDRFAKTAGSLTSNDCYQIILDQTQETEIARQFCDIMADCEAARYAPEKRDINESLVTEVINLVRNIDKKTKP